jgi:antitoxin component of MazEF toxin-antitoxin module
MREQVKIYDDECTGDTLVAVPHQIAAALELNEGDTVECRLAEGRMIVTKITALPRKFGYIELGDAVEDILEQRAVSLKGMSLPLQYSLISVVIARLKRLRTPLGQHNDYYKIADHFVAVLAKELHPEMVYTALQLAGLSELDFNTSKMPSYRAAMLQLRGMTA